MNTSRGVSVSSQHSGSDDTPTWGCRVQCRA
jgi:hypothetical protein